MGRVQDIQDCLPTSATACANKLLTYGYNQAGNVKSMTDSAASPAFTLSSTYDGADQLSTVTSTLNTGNYPGTLFQANSTSSTAPSYGPAGLMNASVGVSGTGTLGTLNRGYDSRTQVTGETDMKGATAVYSYSIAPFNKSNPSASGYDAAGNVVSVSDLVMGTWGYGYDHLNRIASANAAAGSYSSLNMNWTIDAFGDRTAQRLTGSPSAPVPQTWTANMSTGNNNRIAITQPSGANWTYDAGGDVTFDGLNDYLYDGEGRICAVEQAFSPFSKFGYVYDGNGDRIAKGTLTSFSCNLSTNGFALTNSYVVDKDGEQLTEFQGTTPVHTNVYAGGRLLATYSNSNIYFPFTDRLGTKRAEIANNCSSTYASLPYGDELTPHGTCPDATEHHYTGKEHDIESGNDDFGARYYTSTAGRFLSPDWASGAEAVPYADTDIPQSLNLYSYVRNNPLSSRDPDGHSCDPDRSFTDSNGTVHVIAGQCNLDWWDFPGHAWVGLANIMLASNAKQATTGAGQMAEGYTIPLSLVVPVVGAGGELTTLSLEGGAEALLTDGTKQAAKDAVESLPDGPQKDAAKRAVGRATNNEKLSIAKNPDGSLTVSKTRPGTVSGQQTMETRISPGGQTSVVQRAFDPQVGWHIDPKGGSQ